MSLWHNDDTFMLRCEDFPCCGHQIGECPTDNKSHICKECGRSFMPDSMTWNYCYPCGQTPRFHSREEADDWHDRNDE